MKEYFDKIKKFNYWEGNSIKTGFLREEYLNAIQNFFGNKLIKVLVGQRRSGKSYVLRQLMESLIKSGVPAENTFYINKEFLEFDFVKNYSDLDEVYQFFRNRNQPKGKVYLFIDEIQNVKEWERFVNSKSQDFAEDCEIFITGSNSKLLSGELATLLSGRYVQFEIFPFSFSEFVAVHKKEKNRESFLEYMQTGGLPELLWLPNEETKRHYVSSVIDTVLLRDVVQRYAVKDVALLKDIFIYLVNNASNLISINNLVKYFKGKNRRTTYDTLANYISHIQDTFLIHRAERFDIKGKEIIGGTYKFYINDVAYKNYLFSGFGYGLGYLLENLVYLQLRRNNYDCYIGNIGENEIDFRAQKGERIVYVQVSYSLAESSTLDREFRAFRAIQDHYPKVVVSMDDFKLPNREGIDHVRAWEFEDYLKKLS